MRFAVLMCLTLLMAVCPVQATDLAMVRLSLATVEPSSPWPKAVSEWDIAVGSQEVTCELDGAWLQTTSTGRCARHFGASTGTGSFVVTLVDETHFRVEVAGLETVIEVTDLRTPAQARLGPYMVTLLRPTWQRVPGVAAGKNF